MSDFPVEKTVKIQKHVTNAYLHAVWDLWEAGKPIDEANISKLFEAYGREVDQARLRTIIDLFDFLTTVCEE